MRTACVLVYCGRKSFPSDHFSSWVEAKTIQEQEEKKHLAQGRCSNNIPPGSILLHPLTGFPPPPNPCFQPPAACRCLQTVTPIISSPLTAHIPLTAARYVTTNICCGSIVLMAKHISFPSLSLTKQSKTSLEMHDSWRP